MTTNQLFEVTKLQLHTGLEGFDSPEAYGVFKTTGGPALGVVGKDFTPTQPQFINEAFSKCLEGKGIDIDGLKFRELKGGKKVMFSCPVKTFSFKNGVKKDDVISLEVVISTGYDGRTVTSMFVNAERLICTNGMKAFNTEFQVSFKNVKGNIGKANMICDDVVKSINYMDNLKELYINLSNRQITQKEHEAYILAVTGLPMKQYADLSKRKQKILDAINQSVAIEMKDAGETAWALMNGITRFTNHFANFKSKDDFIYADSGLFMNNKAQKYAIELLN